LESMNRRAPTFGALWLAAVLAAAGGVAAQDAPKLAGTDVPPPKRTKFVAPQYPPEAQAQGIRGIVILELLIDEQGKVASVDVIRSIPGLDEAALSAARSWEFEPTRVNGVPVRVRHTIPITFALRLPDMKRQDGIPELRQGAAPAFPRDAPERSATVTAEITLDPQGNVADAQVKTGESPFTEALIQAIRTWRFQAPGDAAVVSFRVRADFEPPARGAPGRVALDLGGLTRSETIAQSADQPQDRLQPERQVLPEDQEPDQAQAPSPGSEPADGSPAAPPTSATEPAAPEATPVPEATPAPEAAPSPGTPPLAVPAAPSPAAPAPVPSPTVPEASAPSPPVPQAEAAAPEKGDAPKAPAPPPVEVIRAPDPPLSDSPPPPPPLEPGVSAVRDVMLGTGVPDLVRGRRPVVPPLARMGGVSGRVVVRFAVDAAGSTAVGRVEGPELLKEAAVQTVASWSFRRTSAERLRLVADLSYKEEAAAADVRLEEAQP